jgi:hypothetical protein
MHFLSPPPLISSPYLRNLSSTITQLSYICPTLSFQSTYNLATSYLCDSLIPKSPHYLHSSILLYHNRASIFAAPLTIATTILHPPHSTLITHNFPLNQDLFLITSRADQSTSFCPTPSCSLLSLVLPCTNRNPAATLLPPSDVPGAYGLTMPSLWDSLASSITTSSSLPNPPPLLYCLTVSFHVPNAISRGYPRLNLPPEPRLNMSTFLPALLPQPPSPLALP